MMNRKQEKSCRTTEVEFTSRPRGWFSEEATSFIQSSYHDSVGIDIERSGSSPRKSAERSLRGLGPQSTKPYDT